MSESVEMYLVMTALLRKDSQPVPLSLLAEKLAISSVSANEMCRKLEDRGLVHYQPYKGVTLSEGGEQIAQEVLSRRRLWVVFLVENLGIEPHEADEIACQLEHITSDRLVDSLKAFVERGPASPTNQSVIQPYINGVPLNTHPLTALPAGLRGQIAALNADGTVRDFLQAQGMHPGAVVEILVVGANGSLVLTVDQRQLSLAHSVATLIEVVPVSGNQPVRVCAWEKCSAFWNCARCESECHQIHLDHERPTLTN